MTSAKVNLRLRFDSVPSQILVTVRLNGRALSTTQSAGEWLEFNQISVEAIRSGENHIEVELDGAAKRLKWLDAVVEVRHAR